MVHLDDLVLRRTLIGLRGEATHALLEELAGIAGKSLGWTPQTMEEEVQQTLQLLRAVHGVSPARLERL